MSPQPAGINTRTRSASDYGEVFRAIATFDGRPTAKDLALETHRSRSQLRRILTELEGRGRVRRVQDPDDGRVYRYEIDAGSTDQ